MSAARVVAVGRALMWLTVMTAAPASALAADSACPDADTVRVDPRGSGVLPTGIGPADFGQVPEACPGFDVLTRLRGVVLVAKDGPDYYGNLSAGALVRFRYPLGPNTWMSVGADVATYRLVINAAVSSHSIDVGPPTVGIYRALPRLGGGAFAVYGRLLLPLDTARGAGVQLGGELGASAFWPGRNRLAFQGGVAVPAPLELIAGQAHARVQPAAVAEAVLRVSRATAISAGMSVRTELGPDPAILAVAARAGARFALGRGIGLGTTVEWPFHGADRTDLVASFLLAWTPPGPPVRTPR